MEVFTHQNYSIRNDNGTTYHNENAVFSMVNGIESL